MSYDDVTKVAYTEHTFGNGQAIISIDPRGSKWHEGRKHTSKYGSENPSEMFSEAVADVYAHGKDARPMSIELVKEYEKRQKAETKKRFFDEQKKPGFFYSRPTAFVPRAAQMRKPESDPACGV